MIFQATLQQVLDGTKRQTRRVVKKGDVASHDEKGNIVAVYREVKDWDFKTKAWRKRLLWKVGKDLAVQPGRGKFAVGRTLPLKAIRRERLLEITASDCIGEGIIAHLVLFDHEYYRPGSEAVFGAPRWAFKDLWDSLHRKRYTWEYNPEVWVLVW